MVFISGGEEKGWSKRTTLTITRKHSIFLLEHKHHMIDGMPGRMECCQGSTLNGEYLALLDIRLSGIRLVFENLSLGTEFEQIWQPVDMVAMPVCQESLVHCCLFFCEHGLKVCCP